ncbi:MAG: pyridoxal-phosphate dependent enzyme [Lachnospiraceae bacterium]|nr:pyridoxal-phosphate dependent enzyme [Lachnospiraceae bacterium]
MIYENVLEAIGHTPMVRLNRMNKLGNAQILVKFEGLNVGGSIKTRTAYNMITRAEQEGKIGSDTVIVEPENAAILAGGNIGTHLQMGIGDGIIPDILNQQIYDEIYIVSDEEALRTAKDLAKKEGIMCGISSGTNVAAALMLAEKLGEGKTVVTVLPDTAERYFSTPLFE